MSRKVNIFRVQPQFVVDKWQSVLGLPFSDWSVARRLWSGYTGPLREIRRSSDDAVASILPTSNGDLDIAGMLDWVGPGNSAWDRRIYDQTGLGRDFIQTTFSRQPLAVSAGTLITRNGLPAAFFDGINDSMAVPASTAIYKWMHDTDDAGFTQQILSVAQFGTSANPNISCCFLATGTGSTNVGFGMVYDDRASFGFNDQARVQVVKGVLGQFVLNSQYQDLLPPNSLKTYSIQTRRNAPLASSAFGYVDQNTASGSPVTSAPSNANASFNLQLGANGNNEIFLLGYFCEAFMYRQSSNLQVNLSPYNADLQTYFNIP